MSYRVAVLASGSGSNFQALVDAPVLAESGAQVVCLLSNVPGARVLARAEAAGVPAEVVSHKDFGARGEFDAAVVGRLSEYKPDLIALAGYMRLLSPVFLRAFPTIINIHPALLPAFPGVHGIRDAFDYGVKVTGVSVHFVDEGMDTGPIIAQEALRIEEGESLEALEERIHKVEHELYPRIISWFAQGRIERQGRRVHVRSDR